MFVFKIPHMYYIFKSGSQKSINQYQARGVRIHPMCQVLVCP